MATWNMYFFQNSNSPYADHLISFHNLVMLILISIFIFILILYYNLFMNKFSNRFLLKNHTLEIIWTIIPIFILLLICFPSLKILYYLDEVLNPELSVKSIGHQWYWSYEYSDIVNLEFDSYMINQNLIESFNVLDLFRLLDVDNRMVIPMNMAIRLIVTSTDVIHSWVIPSLGIKIDAVPSRINQANLFCFRPGVFYGQCSEICGMNHSFMPIVLESTSFLDFLEWMKYMLLYVVD